MTFKLPDHIANTLQKAISDEMIITAFQITKRIGDKYIRTEVPRRFRLPVFCSGTFSVGANRQLVAVDVCTRVLSSAIETQQDRAIATLEKRVNDKLEDGEEITHIDLRIDDQRMISGIVSGKGFHLNIKSIWNYRYGENSANGVLTVYAQTRVTRND